MRAIDADALIECLQTWKTVAVSEGLPINERFATAMIAQVNLMPTIEERKTGKWIVHLYKLGEERYECDNCHGRCDREYKFCPNCGAKMEAET